MSLRKSLLYLRFGNTTPQQTNQNCQYNYQQRFWLDTLKVKLEFAGLHADN